MQRPITIDEVNAAIEDWGLGYCVALGVLEDCEDYRIVSAAQSARALMDDIENYVREDAA